MSTKYNGWTNYATWKVNLSIIEEIQWDEVEVEIKDEVDLENYVENVVFAEYPSSYGLMEECARAFLSSVNYKEIYDSIDYLLS